MKQSKEMVLGLLRNQLEEETQEAQEAIFEDPDGWEAYSRGIGELAVAIDILERHDWELGDEGDNP